MPEIEMRIVMNDSGGIQVSGPIDQAILAYGMLEAAKQAIVEHLRARAEGNRIVPASLIPGPVFGKGNN